MPKKKPQTHTREEFKILIQRLKHLLRERGISYKELAKKMQMSESGVKKIFSADDCSFQKLVEITKILGITLSDLFQEIEREEMTSVSFTPEEQALFLKNKDLFHFFVKLVIERSSVEEIKKESKLTEAQAFKYLRTLDEAGLITLLPENKIQIPPISLVSNFGSGPLLEKTYNTWGHRIVDELAHPRNQESGQFIIRCLKMKDETYQDFLLQLRELEREMAKRALREMAFSTANLKLTRWVSMTSHGSFIPGPLNQLD
ncbi:helix-turn-helix domain-containing protein [Bdellovibrio sp. HCB337]|uniref:helix-turn-helix domain-containing protein n=1 Tax=Bdellovibrio sp. HCB337 TaxID=3394358 RepID=UPI0039A51942